REYYGFYSYFLRGELFTDAKNVAMLREKADGDATYHSVFAKAVNHAARPMLPGGAAEAEPVFPVGEEYLVPPADKLKSVPKNSRRELLCKSAAVGTNGAFNRAIANRLWAMMMGRGVVHPVDLDHADNPPTHPELLDLLANEFATMKYNMRTFIRELALTRTYQRSFDPPADLTKQAET